jgi:uncharacterized protein YlxW (UPF0749 family)
MNRLIIVLSAAIIILSLVSGFLFYQLNAVQSVNSELRNQNAEAQDQLGELQTQNDELENQILEMQNQNSELQNQIDALQNQNDEFQNQIKEQEIQLSNYTDLVEIAEVEVYGFAPLVGVTIRSAADVTIENIGVNDVEGLILSVVHSSTADHPHTENLDVLHLGEKRKINSYVFWAFGTIGNITVTLNLGNVTLDEYTLEDYNIPPFA